MERIFDGKKKLYNWHGHPRYTWATSPVEAAEKFGCTTRDVDVCIFPDMVKPECII